MKTSESGTIKDLAAERALLGAALLEPDQGCARVAGPACTESDFYLRAHQLIYKAILDVYDASCLPTKALLSAVGSC
jgi:replicative DNA helicase